jgi:prolyl oligopeptidase
MPHRSVARVTFIACVFAGVAALYAQQAPPPPSTADPFLWLEDVDGARAMEWVNAKNAATVAELTHPWVRLEAHGSWQLPLPRTP